ncbi:hypothetical protein Pelo_9518 [Pelomyxa schiedti]|nr:hypothetical protein Pelo_9518 [Pelomyxa schiedti]
MTNHDGDSVKWFIEHLSPSIKGSQQFVHDAMLEALKHIHQGDVAVLLQSFLDFEPQRYPDIFKKLVVETLSTNVKNVQDLLGHGGTLSTTEFVAECLTSKSFTPSSSKIVKWVICHFRLNYDQVKGDNNALLSKLLGTRKNLCAEWFIDYYNIPLSDIVDMMRQRLFGIFQTVDLSSWKMLLTRFSGGIEAAMMRDKELLHFTSVRHISGEDNYRDHTVQLLLAKIRRSVATAVTPSTDYVEYWQRIGLISDARSHYYSLHDYNCFDGGKVHQSYLPGAYCMSVLVDDNVAMSEYNKEVISERSDLLNTTFSDSRAMTKLGVLYENGDGVDRDITKAVTLPNGS